MIDPPKKGEPGYLYVEEHILDKGQTFESIAKRMRVTRQTAWRWSVEQRRFHPLRIAEMAAILEIDPREFYNPPGRASIDATLKGATDDDHETTLSLARNLAKR